MGRIEKTVFISYRRTNSYIALAVYQDLRDHGYDVFIDYESIKSGDFEQAIIENIKARAHFVVILTPSALDRCNEPSDWLRREIETALEYKRNIVPVMMEGFKFGDSNIDKHLTGKLEFLKKYQGLEVPMNLVYFKYAMMELRDRYLNIELDAVLHPSSIAVQKAVIAQQTAADKAGRIEQKELTAQKWFEQGYAFGEAKNFDEAIRCYTEVLRLSPTFEIAYYNRGWNRHEKGDLNGAIADYGKAILLKPNFADAYDSRGVARGALGDLNGAIPDFDEAIRLEPELAEAYSNRGAVHKKLGDFDSAIDDCNKAIHLKPELAEAYSNRGTAREGKGDLDAAIADYDKSIRLKSGLAEAYYNRGFALKKKGDLDGAIADFDEAIRLKPTYINAYGSRGVAHHSKGDLEGAMADFDDIIHLKPDDVNTYYHRAAIWEKKENYYAAISDYQKYLDLGGGIRYNDQREVEGFIRKLKRKIK